MERTGSFEDLIEQYLLGELTAEEQIELEDEYFADPFKYEQVCKVEDQLIDRYVRGALLPADRERFERCYSTNPKRREHVKFAKALTQVVNETLASRPAADSAEARAAGPPVKAVPRMPEFRTPARGPRFGMGLALTAATLLILFGVTWFATETSRLRAQLAAARRELKDEQDRSEMLTGEITALGAQGNQLAQERDRLKEELDAAQAAASQSAPTSVFFALSLDAFRDSASAGPRPLVIGRGTSDVRLRVNLSQADFPGYQIELLTPDGKQVFSRKGLKAKVTKSGAALTLNVPAIKFAQGDNIVGLSGISATGETESLGKVIIKVNKR